MRRLLILALALLLCMPLSIISAGANTVEGYTSALEDLSSCEGFSQAKYPPIDSKEYATIQVIHVAESEDNQIFVYTYQPSAKSIPLVATQVSIGTTNSGEPGSYKLYNLQLLSQDGVFQKYLVRDFLVSDADIRYYDIPAIYRPFNAALDAAPTDDNTINGIGIEVGFMWTYSGAGENYTAERQEVITVTKHHAGFLRYKEDLYFYAAGKDSHYIAFDTDKNIDELLSADISYYTVSVRYLESLENGKFYSNKIEQEDPVPKYATISHEDIFGNAGLFGSAKYEFDRIQSAADFVENEDLKDASIDALDGCKWVLRFLETDYSYSKTETGYFDSDLHWVPTGYIVEDDHIRVKEVTILRLSFLDDGVPYNMGVVSNIISGDDVQDNKDDGVPDWFITALIVLAILVLLVVLWVLSIFAPVLKPVLSALVWVLLLPFKLIWWIIQKIYSWIRS